MLRIHNAAIRKAWRMVVGRTPLRSIALLVSLSVVTGTLLILFPVLSQSTWYWPAGVSNHGDYVTLGMRNAAGSFTPATLHQLSVLNDSAYRERLLVYSEQRLLVHTEDVELTSDVAFVGENVLEALGIAVTHGRHPSVDEQAVVLGADFARRQFGSIEAALHQRLHLGKERISFAVAGILDQQFAGLGRRRPDMVIALVHAPTLQDVDIPGLSPANKLQVARGVAEALPAYGILKINFPNEKAAIARAFKKEVLQRYEIKVNDSRMVLNFPVDSGARTVVTAGIDLDPDRTSLIGRYLDMLSILFGVLALILVANYAVHLIAALLNRIDEIKLRVVLGARSWELLRLVIGDQVLLVPTAIGLASVLAISGLDWIVRHSTLADYFAGREPELSLGAMIWAGSFLLLVTLGASIAPLALIRQLVSGARTVSQSASRLWVWNTAGILLWSLCFVALSGSVLVSANTWHMRQVDYGTRDVYYARLNESQAVTVADFTANLQDPARVAFADEVPLSGLDRQAEFRLPNSHIDASVNATVVKVSGNFFDVLGPRLVAGRGIDERSPRTVVISESIARQLGVEPQTLIGQTLTIEASKDQKSEPDVVGGVVADIRYDSLYGPGQPVVYRTGDVQGSGQSSGDVVTFRAAWKPRYVFSAELFGGRIAKKIAPAARLSIILENRTRLESLLGNSIVFATIGALLIMTIGLVSEMFATVQSKKREYALYLSCGASRAQLVSRLLVDRVPLVLCGMLFAVFFTWLFKEDLQQVLPFVSPGDGWLVLLSAIVFFCILLGVLAGIAYRNMKPDLITLLRTEH